MKIFKGVSFAVACFSVLAGPLVYAQSGSKLNLVGAGEFESSHPNYPPGNVIDGSTAHRSRWASRGEPRNVWVDLGSVQDISEVGVAWDRGDERKHDFEVRAHTRLSGSWAKVYRGESSGRTSNVEIYNVDNVRARYVRIKVFGNNAEKWQNITEVEVFGSGSGNSDSTASDNGSGGGSDNDSSGNGGGSGQFGLNPNAEPWENFDLSDWAIDTPAFADDGDSERFGENDWDDISRESRRFFFTHTDGGMRFVTRLDGARTSSGTSYVRSELREMLRRGNTIISTRGANGNNWALGYQPGNTDHGGRNGVLTGTLRVNKVTTTGNGIHVGRTIIGQIHASDDEPLRLYYHKYPGDSRGCIYAESEIRDGDDVNFSIIGNEDCDNPSNGIALNELFSYEIINDDHELIVRIRRGDRDGRLIATRTIDMNRIDSDYDRSSEWMYFKAGAYTQNNRGRDSDGDIITFYRLNNSHDRN